MLSLPDGLVWIASFPKSGNTWMRVLLSNLFAERDSPEDINNLSLRAPIAASRWAFEQEMLVDSLLLTEPEIERLRPAFHDAQAEASHGGRFMKTHDAFTRLPDSMPLHGRRARAALYLVRDPRDIALSLACHFGLDMPAAIEMISRDDRFLGDNDHQMRQRLTGWNGHVRSWLDQTETPVHLIRYEDLRADPVTVFRRALEFLGVAATPEAIMKAVGHADFSEMQRQEREKGFKEKMSPEASFFRRGAVGEWRDRLTADQIFTIESANNATMRRLGYQPGTQESAA